MKSPSWLDNPEYRVPVAGLLGWILPGSGHLLIGERARGLIFLVVITLTFWTGMAVGGVKNTVNPNERRLWFMGQICAGSHALVALAWSNAIPDPPLEKKATLVAYGRAEEVSVVYTAISGMLNILIIFDVLVRAEKGPVRSDRRGPPGRTRGASS